MAEYINKEKLKTDFDDKSYYISHGKNNIERGMTLNGINQMIEEQQPADVIERSKHLEQVKYIQDNLKTYIDNIRDNYYAIERRYNRLKADVDKAIEEMERYGDGFDDIGKHNLGSAVENCIEILKRNIGE